MGLELIPRNYRPVCNLCFLSKVVVKCMLKKFIGYCHSQELIPQYQSAYRANHSCKTSLLRLLNNALWNRECSKVTILTAMDLFATLEMVDHDISLNILHDHFGLTVTALNWFDSYLRPPSCVVTVQKLDPVKETWPLVSPKDPVLAQFCSLYTHLPSHR